jgi:hypothetical protein
MKRARDLSHPELLRMVEQIQNLLYLDLGEDGDYFNPAKEWGSETIEAVAGVLEDYGLAPRTEIPVNVTATPERLVVRRAAEEAPAAVVPTTNIYGLQPLNADEDCYEGDIDIDGVPHHALFIGVTTDEQGTQVATKDPYGRFDDLAALNDEALETVGLPDKEGEYVCVIYPLAR